MSLSDSLQGLQAVHLMGPAQYAATWRYQRAGVSILLCMLQIMVNPDQTKLLRDTLHVIINEGDDLMFPVTAVGAGQLITCDASATGVDFGHQFIGGASGFA